MKARIYRRHPLNMHLGRARIAGRVSKQKSHPTLDLTSIQTAIVYFIIFDQYTCKTSFFNYNYESPCLVSYSLFLSIDSVLVSGLPMRLYVSSIKIISKH